MRSAILFCIAMFATCTVLVESSQAQLQVATIHLLVLRGRSAKPIRNVAVSTTILPLETYATPIQRTTNVTGEVSLLVQRDAEVRVTVLHDPTCHRVPKAERKLPSKTYAVQQILSSGAVSENSCGRHTVAPTPGELTLFVRPLHWWERMSY